jgi:hypothetical protein
VAAGDGGVAEHQIAVFAASDDEALTAHAGETPGVVAGQDPEPHAPRI